MKIYKFKYSFNNDEAVFNVNSELKIENSYFSKEEIKKYLYFTDIKNFSLMNEIDMRKKRKYFP